MYRGVGEVWNGRGCLYVAPNIQAKHPLPTTPTPATLCVLEHWLKDSKVFWLPQVYLLWKICHSTLVVAECQSTNVKFPLTGYSKEWTFLPCHVISTFFFQINQKMRLLCWIILVNLPSFTRIHSKLIKLIWDHWHTFLCKNWQVMGPIFLWFCNRF